MKKLKYTNGFTLIEMLISLVVFSIMIGLAAYSFRFYTGLVDKVIMPYPEKAVNFSKLRNAIDSAFYFVGEKNTIMGKNSFYYYFYGEDKQMEFISSKPILSDKLSVCRIYEKNGNLVWEESPVYDKQDNYKNPKVINPKSKVIFKDISSFHISYYDNNQMVPGGIKEKMPDMVEIKFNSKDNKPVELFFTVKSNFKNKKKLMGYFYAPF